MLCVWELKHLALLSWNLKPPRYFPNPNLFQQTEFKTPQIWTVSSVLRLKIPQNFGRAFPFPSKISPTVNISSIYTYSIPVKSQDQVSGNEPRQKMVLIPVQKDQWDNWDYSQAPDTWRLIQMPTLKEFCQTFSWRPTDSSHPRKALPSDTWYLNTETRTALVQSLQTNGATLTSLRLLRGHILGWGVASSRPWHRASHLPFFTKYLRSTFFTLDP